MPRIVMISNRLPLGEPASGGLVVALNAVLCETRGVWVGHSGKVTEQPEPELKFHDGPDFLRASFDLTEREHVNYYLGFSNSVLWPVFHGRPDLIEIRPDHLDGYRSVNVRIADLVIPHLRQDDCVWVQDYHLFPLAAALRERGFGGAIGHFLHVPFPDLSALSYLSNASELLAWFSHYDLLGFQTGRDLNNFMKWVQVFPDCIGETDKLVRLQGRLVNVGEFPVGIDTSAFSQSARDVSATDHLGEAYDVLTMISVDRMDYTKGIPERLRALKMLFETHSELQEKVSLIQIASPTRSGIGAYQQIRRETERLVGSINGAFGTINWVPIHSIHQMLPRSTLAKLYRQSRIGLVTPLADGMNLVAKEYVAAQDDANPGVLILSRFAGAAEKLNEALQVNPSNAVEVADAMYQAIHMSLDERQDRHGRLMRKIIEHDVAWWAGSYLGDLQRIPAISTKDSCRSCGACRSAICHRADDPPAVRDSEPIYDLV